MRRDNSRLRMIGRGGEESSRTLCPVAHHPDAGTWMASPSWRDKDLGGGQRLQVLGHMEELGDADVAMAPGPGGDDLNLQNALHESGGVDPPSGETPPCLDGKEQLEEGDDHVGRQSYEFSVAPWGGFG